MALAEQNMIESGTASAPQNSVDKYAAVFDMIHNFLEYYEKFLWEKDTNAVKVAFKTAKLCELMHAELSEEDCMMQFEVYLSRWYSIQTPNSRPKRYGAIFFRNACDHLLGKFLRAGNSLSNEIVRQAVQSYISLCSEERLTVSLDVMASDTLMFKSVCNIKDSVNCKHNTSKEHDGNFALQHLSQLTDLNQIDIFKKSILTSLDQNTIYNVLHSNFGRKPVITTDDETKNLLILTLLETLESNVHSCSKFWKISSQNELDLLAQLANKYPNFLSAMIRFIWDSGQSMKMSFDDKFQLSWTSSDSFLTYEEVVALLKSLIKTKGSAESTIKTFLLENSGNNEDDTCIWSHLVYFLNLYR